jgi:RND family efflux transporter MFP subunit
LGALAGGCGGRAESAASAEVAAELGLEPVETTTITVPLSLPGQLYVEHDAWVYARSTGIVESLLVDLGSEAPAGSLLAQLEQRDQVLALGQAEISLDNARRELERQRTLAQSRLVATADSERAEFEFRRADLALQQARRALELTRITAPFAGVVSARAVRPGQLVGPGDSLFRVTALGPLRVRVHVPEGAAAGLAVGAAVAVGARDGGALARARVVRAAPTIDAASGTREVIVELLPGAPRSMRPGNSVTVRLGGERRSVVAIPADLVVEDGYVLVWADGRTTLRPVTLGATLEGGRVEVLSGLSPGERLAPPRSAR